MTRQVQVGVATTQERAPGIPSLERPDKRKCQTLAEIMIGSYPNLSPNDLKTYLRAIRITLGCYPEEVALQIASPRTGIVTRSKFPPTVAELHSFAKPLVQELYRRLREATPAVAPPVKANVSDEDRRYVADGLRALRDTIRETCEQNQRAFGRRRPIKPIQDDGHDSVLGSPIMNNVKE